MRRNQLLLLLSLTLSGCAAQQGEAPVETPSLPPEPKAQLHEQAHEAPQLEQDLAENEAYAHLWSLPREDLNLFLTCVSEFLSDHQLGIQQATYDQLGSKNLEEALIKIVMFHARTSKVPDDFAENFKQHLTQTLNEPNLGVWSKHNWTHDYSALAAWIHQRDPAYLRARIAAKNHGDFGWAFPWTRTEAPLRPWLVEKKAAAERLALLVDVTTDDCKALNMSAVVMFNDKTGKTSRHCAWTEGLVSAEKYREHWPLTVYDGRLSCHNVPIHGGKFVQQVYFYDPQGNTYAINGAARSCVGHQNNNPKCPKAAVYEIDPIWRADPKLQEFGLKINIQTLINDGLLLCAKK